MKTNTYTVYLQVMLSVEVKATSMFAAEKLAQNLAEIGRASCRERV